MISLITAKDVRARMSLPDDEGINASIKSCIVGATLSASSLLQTEFDSARRMSVFFIDGSVEVSQGNVYTLRLSNGFVVGDLTVKVGTDFDDMLSGGGEALVKEYQNGEKGWVHVLKNEVVGKYVSVLGDYGFSSAADVPDWLKEVVLGLTIKMLASQQVSDGKPTLSNVVPMLDQHILALVDNHRRSCSICISPIYTMVVTV